MTEPLLEGWENEALAMAPHSVQAEQAILITLLQHPNVIHELAGTLKPEHFYVTAHQYIYQAALTCYRQADPVDPVFLTETLRDQGALEAAGGASYVTDLALKALDGVATLPESLSYWKRRLLDLAQRRELMRLGYELVEASQDTAEKAYMTTAQSRLMAIQEAFTLEEASTAEHMLDQAMAAIDARLNSPGGVTGLPTGFPKLDRMTHGFQAGQLISIGARPGGGKTALGMNITTHIIMQEKKPVLYFSLEMAGHELMERTLHAIAGTNIKMAHLQKAREALKGYEDLFLIEDKAEMTLTAIQAKLQQAKAARPELAMAVIDHLGLIASEPDGHRRFQNRAYEMGHMTRTFKMLAKSLRMPILLLCQLNREIENRPNKKPQLSDLRDTGSIEMDSDIVLFTYIDRDESRQPTGQALLTIAKQRNGALGEIPLCFVPHLTLFKERNIS